MRRRRGRRGSVRVLGVVTLLVVLVAAMATGCSGDDDDGDPPRDRDEERDDDSDEPGGPQPTSAPVEPLRTGSFDPLIPRPTVVEPGQGTFSLTDAVVVVEEGAGGEGAGFAAELLVSYLAPATGRELPVVEGGRGADPSGPPITFTLAEGATAAELGDEGYDLTIEPDQMAVVAASGVGFGWAVQTIRQLLPPEIESAAVQPGSWALPVGRVRDVPRFAWRGVMLDVARHFFPPDDVKRVIDLAALYKLNRFHLHLSDDQGWRLQIDGYPELTDVGGSTEFGGGAGGYYTQDEFRDLVDYAAARGITVVPEIDLPGHVTAALASVPALNCEGAPPAVATGFSNPPGALCVDHEPTYRFVQDVITEVAALTLGRYLHIGGDEAATIDAGGYATFLGRVLPMVQAAGKQPVGWDEVAATALPPGTIVQHWSSAALAEAAAAQGAGLVMSPASHAYLDMKYDDSTELGLRWAGPTNTQDAYEWDPLAVVPAVPPAQVLGVEAPLWTETIADLGQIEQMLLPRLPGIAELGWSAPEGLTWDEYRTRLAAHAPRWTASGRVFTPDPVVPWP